MPNIHVQVHTYLGLDTVGMAEFFALLYIAYEVVSIFKIMALCGLPVKKVGKRCGSFWQSIRTSCRTQTNWTGTAPQAA